MYFKALYAMSKTKLTSQIRIWIIFFVIVLVLSGVTAFPIQTEINYLANSCKWLPTFLYNWILQIQQGINDSYAKYPFLAYGTDWLAFAHIVIGMAFYGVYKNPVRNIWIIDWAMLCCLAVFPLTFIAGYIRHIPFFHQVIDCSFGIIGLIPLKIVKNKILKLEAMQT